MRINFKLIFLYIFAFISLYLPNFSYYIKVNGIVLFCVCLLIYLFKYMSSRDYNILNLFKDKSVVLFILFNIFFTLYYFIRTAIAGVSLFDFYNLRIFQNLFPILLLIAVVFIYYELDNINYTKYQKYEFLINVATFQGILALLMIVFPAFREVAYNIFYQDSSEINIYISASRLYGICDGNYTYAFQVLHSILGLFSLCVAYFYKKPKLYINTILIILVSILNGRTGILIFLLGFVLLLLYILIKERKLFKFLKFSIVIVFAILFSFILIQKFLPSTAILFEHAINDVMDFTNNSFNDANETNHLISGLKLPNSFPNILLGAGYRIYGGAGFKFGYFQKSDIGFVNDIFMAGIFSLLFLYNSYFIFIKNIYKSKNYINFNKFFVILLCISMFMANFKGELFRSQMLISLVLFLLFFMYKGEDNND